MPEHVGVRVDGETVQAEAGLSVSALLFNLRRAATRRSVGGQARGPLCAMGICQECRVSIDGAAHRRACLETCREGMEILTDVGEGDVPRQRTAAVARATHDVDVAVVGAGPAGIAAAVRAAEAGARVALVDTNPRAGGQIWRQRRVASLPPAARGWLERLEATPALRLSGASVVDALPGELLVAGVDHVAHVRWACLVIATGARELFLPYPGWTLPNVIGVGGAQALAKSGADFTGRDVVVAGSGPLLLPVAALLAERGARVRCVAEQASAGSLGAFALGLWREPHKLSEAVAYRLRFLGAPYLTAAWVSAAHPTPDGVGVEAVTATDGRRSWRIPCDLLACGFGLVPNLELARLLGCRIESGAVAVDARQQTSIPNVFAAGEATGVAGADAALAEGQIAGLAASGRQAPDASRLARGRRHGSVFAARLARTFAPRDALRRLAAADTLVCRCEDITDAAVREHGGRRVAKLMTRVGMGACQGRVCGAALEFLMGWGSDSVRPPLEPVPLRALLDPDEGGQ